VSSEPARQPRECSLHYPSGGVELVKRSERSVVHNPYFRTGGRAKETLKSPPFRAADKEPYRALPEPIGVHGGGGRGGNSGNSGNSGRGG